MLVQYLKRNVHFPTSNGFVRRIVQCTFYFAHEAYDFQIVFPTLNTNLLSTIQEEITFAERMQLD